MTLRATLNEEKPHRAWYSTRNSKPATRNFSEQVPRTNLYHTATNPLDPPRNDGGQGLQEAMDVILCCGETR